MSPADRQLDDQLLAYHMGWLNRAEMESVELLIASSPVVAARSKELSDSLEPLADWNALPVTEDLESQILHRVQRETGVPVVPAGSRLKLDPVPAIPARVLGVRLSLKELLAAAACLVLLLTLVLPAVSRSWSGIFRLRAEGGFLVAADFAEGAARLVEVQSLLGRRCRIQNPWGETCVVRTADHVVTRTTDRVVQFDTLAGHAYLLTAAGRPLEDCMPIPVKDVRNQQPGLPGRNSRRGKDES